MWNSIPGGLDKVSTSSMGFAWGIGAGDVYVCQLPCSGQWKKVDSGAIDIVTDDNHVYVLTSTSLKIKSASNVDEWVVISSPNLTSIVCTTSYIWGQTGGKTFRLAKPGTTGNWIPVENLHTITSASSNSLYGVDSAGNAIKTDEAMQSAWSIIPDFIGSKFSKVIGDLDQTSLYGIDTTNQLKRCVMGKCYQIETDGRQPKSITADPVSKTLWMTTQTTGDKGNIFTMLDSGNDILNGVKPLDKQRDDVVNQTKSSFKESTHSGIMSKQIKVVSDFLVKFFNVHKEPNTELKNKELTENVDKIHEDVQQLESALPTIKIVVLYILGAALAYSLFSVIGWASHIVALGILGYGLYDVYFLRPKTING
jgi:hypothetical protein